MIRSVVSDGVRVPYELVQTVRSSIEVRVTDSGVKVFAPKGVRLSTVDAFVKERARWILDAQQKMTEYQKEHEESHPIAENAPILMEGRVCRLHLDDTGRDAQGLQGDVLTVHTGKDLEPRDAVRAYLTRMAGQRVRESLDRYIPVVGRAPGRVTIREQKTRWGSCSNLGNVNFNWKLVMAPPGALDYVVIHELCHLYELNHSRRFWDRVEKVMPDYRDWIRWLKENGHMLGV